MGRERLSDGRAERSRAWTVGVALALAWVLLYVWALRTGPTGSYSLGDALRGTLAALGLGEPLESREQTILRLRALRVLAALGVGASLALSGGLLQGLFRNVLASPGVLGVTAGSSLGAALAIASIGGFGPGLSMEGGGALAPVVVTLAALAGALLVLVPLGFVASAGGRVSVPTLLLAGMAMNALCSALLAALQSLTLGDFEVARALFAWAFGTLDDRAAWQVALPWLALVVGVLAIPLVARELDLLATGDEDASALGVRVPRVRTQVLVLSALLAAAAVSVAGQILFVGLLAPHAVRLVTGSAHARLLPLSALAGGVLLAGADCLQRTWLPDVHAAPGVLMSLLGAPFFLYILARQREELSSW